MYGFQFLKEELYRIKMKDGGQYLIHSYVAVFIIYGSGMNLSEFAEKSYSAKKQIILYDREFTLS